MLDLVWLVPALPLAGFLVLVVAGRRLGDPLAGWLATALVGGSFVAACGVFAALARRPSAERFASRSLFDWVPVGNFGVDVGFLIDPLSMTMTLFITGIATLIHLYSIGYMRGDERFGQFFCYLNLFVFSMLMLVLGDNLLVTFLGWEGVGACSYLLISFWFTEPANASAGKKAFVTNRVGDWGFLVAMFLAFATVGSIRYVDVLVAASTGEIAAVTATGIALLLLVGAIGKSAQLPLFVWLPDAMAGPTPVSALIHAATMVTAGVYLLVRMNPLLVASYDWVPQVVAWLGAATALFAATVAVAQNDIKRVLAYSTISQLGYLFLAVGVGGYVPAIFHMVTHAFFKALLFLGAGSVIHAMHHEQDMRRFGGLRKFLPVTCATFIVGWLAIAGIPPFSGFWSKDEILAYAWDENIGLWAVGWVTAVLTAFYMSRQVFMTFFGRYRYADATPEELVAAWDAKVAGADAGTAEAQEALATARADVEAARAAVAGAEESAVAARAEAGEAGRAAAAVGAAQLEAARLAVTEAGDDKEARKAAQASLKELEKPAKDLERAEKAAGKADDALVTARQAVATAESRVEELAGAAALASRQADDVRAEAARRRPAATSSALAEAPNTVGVEDALPPEVEHRRHLHPHESPPTMLIPLVVLALGAVGAGVLNLPFSDGTKLLERWLEPSTLGNEHHLVLSGLGQLILAVVTALAALVAIVAAAMVYLRGRLAPETIEKPVLAHAWYVDETLAGVTAGPGRAAFDGAAAFDREVVDGSVNGAAGLVRLVAGRLRVVQTGYVRNYALGVAVGSAVLIGLFLSRATF